MEHPSDDDLERYAIGTLPDSACAALEEHLLICEVCQDRLAAEIEFVKAIRSAAAKIRESGTGE